MIQKLIRTNDNSVPALLRIVLGSILFPHGAQKMLEYREKALSVLHEFPSSEMRDALEEMVNYTTDRKH